MDWPRLVACGFGNSVPGVRAVGRQRTDLGVTAPSGSGIFPVQCAARSDNTDALAHTDLNPRVLADLRPCRRTRLSGPIATAGFLRAFGCVLEAPQDLLCPQSCRGTASAGSGWRTHRSSTYPVGTGRTGRLSVRAATLRRKRLRAGRGLRDSCGNCGRPIRQRPCDEQLDRSICSSPPRRLRNGGLVGLAVPVRSRRTGKRNECRSWGVEYDKQARPLT